MSRIPNSRRNLLPFSIATTFALAAVCVSSTTAESGGDPKKDETARFSLRRSKQDTKVYHLHRSGVEFLRITGDVQGIDDSKVKIEAIDDITIEFMIEGIVAFTRKPGETVGCMEDLQVFFVRKSGQYIWIWAPSKGRFEYIEYLKDGLRLYDGKQLEAKRKQFIGKYLKRARPRSEQGDARQPATASDSKSEGNEKAKPESETRPQ